MDKYLVMLRYDDECSFCFMTLKELANKVVEEEQLAGVLDEWIVYRLIPKKDPIRMKAVEDFGCGWMGIKLYDGTMNLVDSMMVDRP